MLLPWWDGTCLIDHLHRRPGLRPDILGPRVRHLSLLVDRQRHAKVAQLGRIKVADHENVPGLDVPVHQALLGVEVVESTGRASEKTNMNRISYIFFLSFGTLPIKSSVFDIIKYSI